MKRILFRYIIAIFIAIILVEILFACSNSTSTTSTENSQGTLDSVLLSILQQNGESQYYSSISATVQCGNKAPVNGVAGTYRLNEFGRSINSNSLSQIGSITKSFASVVLLQLSDEPEYNFSLNDTLSKWFPEYPQWGSITIIQLLNMSSGIPSYDSVNDFYNDTFQNPYKYIPPQELVATVEGLPLLFTPGTAFYYSNTDYVLAGLLIEKITGNSPITEIQNRVINKLNLTNTYFPVNLPEAVAPIAQLINGYITGYSDDTDTVEIYNITLWELSWAYTSGAIISNPTDINTYIHALYTPGELLTQSEITSLTTNLISKRLPYQHISDVSESIPTGYGLGVGKEYTPSPAGSFYYYGGETLGFIFYYAYYPALDMYIVYTTNSKLSIDSFSSIIESLFEFTVTTQCGENIPFYNPK